MAGRARKIGDCPTRNRESRLLKNWMVRFTAQYYITHALKYRYFTLKWKVSIVEATPRGRFSFLLF